MVDKKLTDAGAGVVIEEDAVGVEFAADLDEGVVFGEVALHAVAGEEVDLAPVRAGVEVFQQCVEVAQVGPVVGAGGAGDREDGGVALVEGRDVGVVTLYPADLEGELLVLV